jgi:chromosome segregation ATPase
LQELRAIRASGTQGAASAPDERGPGDKLAAAHDTASGAERAESTRRAEIERLEDAIASTGLELARAMERAEAGETDNGTSGHDPKDRAANIGACDKAGRVLREQIARLITANIRLKEDSAALRNQLAGLCGASTQLLHTTQSIEHEQHDLASKLAEVEAEAATLRHDVSVLAAELAESRAAVEAASDRLEGEVKPVAGFERAVESAERDFTKLSSIVENNRKLIGILPIPTNVRTRADRDWGVYIAIGLTVLAAAALAYMLLK